MFLLEFVVFLDLPVRGHQRGDLALPVFTHSLQSGIFSDCVINLHSYLVDLHLQVIYLASHIGNILLVDINLDFVLVLGAFFFVEQ